MARENQEELSTTFLRAFGHVGVRACASVCARASRRPYVCTQTSRRSSGVRSGIWSTRAGVWSTRMRCLMYTSEASESATRCLSVRLGVRERD
ncbi:hypothetical protein CRG98_003790 [Punica granatum]|uniref:Uncharacterized protein n=1 Tax=Punica granatum TaxID=22663 RepID=A0A2I0L593_PUNGR|nr:hypothetical protein CRG98_003790 [Punica granatum]